VRDRAANVSTVVSDTINLDTSVKGITGVSINDGALFTNQVTVTLSLPARTTISEMIVSNDGAFAGASWEPFSVYRSWQITQYGSYVIPRTVYVKYKDVNGNVSANYGDDIILDVNAPSGSVSIEGAGGAGVQGQGAGVQAPMPHASAWGRDAQPLPRSPLSVDGERVGGEVASAAAPVTLRLSASDDVSGVGGMMVSNSPSFAGATWESFAASKSWSMESGGKVYVAFKDNAGNASPVYAAALSGSKDSLPSLVLGAVHPKTGGQLASTETNTTVTFPPGAVEAKAEVTLVPAVETALQTNTGSLKSAGKFLTLTAKAGETSLTSVSKAYTITVGYTTADVAGIDESTLGMFWWNGSSWQKELGSRVDTSAKTVSAALDHLSAFAVLGESSTRKIYLPLVIKSYGSGW
ncbi:MAG: hypothetical protein Q8O76_09265, partial [Chloroflexota bacterium]|nr:hypothetical protein [Chloroflexota bacterium]